ncbi:16S rRNA (cytosine(967)-C(5))-methyltransferase RsmB [Ramlibacter humi]|uniref:16S rRNA (Cytosine(967)-C(5))-methyltransferase RsmB n=1 Tax=Ramlibacter humi TaxID=2530451 RepID=A0A4Z0BZ21_9BURK|nr:16S rRNA (cytosine(967)-C(5))-methyltransferase RsmB [Ramlibacter humi]TFZ03530.1 16S rRNA (cytosine(967)-C(5))-methyltransferase RsmB [Ramlibacter humi]
MTLSAPLWRQLQAAAAVLAAVRGGESATPVLARVPADLRAAAQSLSFHAMRQLGRAEALRRRLAKRPPPPAADALLCTALALAWDPQQAPYEPFTLVDQAVEAAKRDPATAAQSGFINACLRRLLRERDALVAQTETDPVARWNHPRWWIDALKRDHPQQWQQVLTAANEPPPMTLRANVRRTTRDELLARFAQQDVQATPVGEHGLIVDRPRPVQELPGFAEGWWSVQDAAAQLAAPLLVDGLAPREDQPLRLLDACAAPGGKTAHLLELVDAEVTAIEIDPQRCERIRGTLDRLGLQAKVLAADAADVLSWWDGQPFDGILLDAPCTASGIVRRHPDVRWLRRPGDLQGLAAQQTRLLEALWPLVRPGGRLLYCTCSVFPAEGRERVQAFVAHHTTAVLRPAPGHLLPRTGEGGEGVRNNPVGDHDGFFYGLLEKT